MADDWEDDDFAPAPSATASGNTNNFQSDGGTMFTKGRGFNFPSKKISNNNDDFGNSNETSAGGNTYRQGGNSFDNAEEDSGWGSSANADTEYRPRGGGRGGRGSRGDGKSQMNRRNDNSNNEWNDNKSADNEWGGGDNQSSFNNDRGRRGGRGRGGGGFRHSNFENDDNGEQSWDGDSGNRSSYRGGRGGGGRGRGRGGSHGGTNNDGGEEWGGGGAAGETEGGEPSKPREIYIPPEPTQDENEIFANSIMTGINFSKYDDIEVQVSGENVPPPITSFENSGLRPFVLDNIKRSGYTKPTPIQKHSIPIIMSGRDLMACAQTGSGKTAAFLLPIINTLLANPKDLVVDEEKTEPQVVIVSPTRELAIQIYDQARKFSLGSSIKIVIAYGGTSVAYQRKHVLNGCHILVATPGRMNDFVKRGYINFGSVRFIVLDEADRMLDMGFLSNVEEMLGHETMVSTGDRRTLMFSATFPEEIQHLAAKFLDNYVFVAVGIVGGACTDVEQVVYQVDRIKKRNKLVEILKNQGTERTLIFVGTKRNADFLASYLSENDYKCTSLHGDRLQREREEALNEFKRGKRDILVATAVAARGLDINDVKHVINYDLPKDIDEYVHRIGRTGRLGNRGKATSFFDEGSDASLAEPLGRILKGAGQMVPDWLQHSGEATSNSAFGGRDIRSNNFDQPSIEVEEENW